MAEQNLPVSKAAEWNPANELVVATEHVGFVREHLGSSIQQVEHSSWLGLSRLLLSTKDAAAKLVEDVEGEPDVQHVKEALAKQAAAVAAVTLVDGGEEDITAAEDDRMSSVLADLRALAIVHHGGWMPTIGRNRLVELPGSGELAVTSKTSYGTNRATGAFDVDSKTSYGGSGAPRRLTSEDWNLPAPRISGPGAGVRVGLVDTRLWPHPWLAGGWVARPTDLLPLRTEWGRAAGHGTFVAGLILSQAPGATIEVRTGLDETGQGTTWGVAGAIADLAQSGVSVINLSFTGYTADGQPPLILARAVDRVDANVVVVGAAGNHAALGSKESEEPRELGKYAALPSWPAALDDVVAVGSLGLDGHTAEFSPSRPWVDLAVRGERLRSTYIPHRDESESESALEGDWAEWCGTTVSAALVSGGIAASVDPGRLTAREVLDNLLLMTSRQSPNGGQLAPSAPARLRVRDISWYHGPKE